MGTQLKKMFTKFKISELHNTVSFIEGLMQANNPQPLAEVPGQQQQQQLSGTSRCSTIQHFKANLSF